MRILHVTDVFAPGVGGIEIFVADLVARQRDAGHEVTVLTSTSGADDGSGAVLAPRRHRWAPSPVFAGSSLALAGGFDVVHAHLSVVSPFSTVVARATAGAGVPTVHTVHSLWRGRGGWVRATGALAGWERSCAVWTAVSPVAARDVRSVLGEDLPVTVVPNAVDVDWWRSGPWMPREPGTVTVVSVMRLAGRKRPLPYVAMLEQVRRSVPATTRLRAVIVGDGPQADRVGSELVRRAIADWVTLTGRLSREEIRALYGTADVYVAPARLESFGIAALEARAAGLPVVAMASGGVGGFVADGVEGVLCADDGAMVGALAGLASDPAALGRLQEHNRSVPTDLGWPQVLDRFEEVYALAHREAAASRAGRAPAGPGVRAASTAGG